MARLLKNKTAIIYGAGGGIGGGVARAFALEGARVFLAGRTRTALEAVAADITAADGAADVAVVDALDERAVEEHVGRVVTDSGHVDVSFSHHLARRRAAGPTRRYGRCRPPRGGDERGSHRTSSPLERRRVTSSSSRNPA